MTFKQKSLTVLILSGIVLTGCVSAEERQVAFEKRQQKLQAIKEKEAPLRAEILRTTPKCQSKSECDSKMEAAYLWVSKNADYKIREANSVMIETYEPARHVKDFGVTVEKNSISNQQYAIVATMACGVLNQNPITSCRANLLQKTIEFNNFVNIY